MLSSVTLFGTRGDFFFQIEKSATSQPLRARFFPAVPDPLSHRVFTAEQRQMLRDDQGASEEKGEMARLVRLSLELFFFIS